MLANKRALKRPVIAAKIDRWFENGFMRLKAACPAHDFFLLIGLPKNKVKNLQLQDARTQENVAA
jgi:hypothetical protein